MKSIQYWCVVLALVSSNVGAQNSDSWDWKIAPNLWMVLGDNYLGRFDDNYLGRLSDSRR